MQSIANYLRRAAPSPFSAHSEAESFSLASDTLGLERHSARRNRERTIVRGDSASSLDGNNHADKKTSWSASRRLRQMRGILDNKVAHAQLLLDKTLGWATLQHDPKLTCPEEFHDWILLPPNDLASQTPLAAQAKEPHENATYFKEFTRSNLAPPTRSAASSSSSEADSDEIANPDPDDEMRKAAEYLREILGSGSMLRTSTTSNGEI